MILRCVFCVLFSMLVASMLGLFAQEASEQNAEVRTKVIYKEKSYYDFEDTLIRGDKVGPEGSSVFRKDRVKFKSSLNLSRSFMPELKDSSVDAR